MDVALGQRIKAARAAKGMSQEELAARLDVRGATVNAWEQGTLPSGKNLAQLPDLLDVNGHWLLTGEGLMDRYVPAELQVMVTSLVKTYRQWQDIGTLAPVPVKDPKPPRKTTHNDWVRRRTVQLYHEGMDVTKIAKALDRTPHTIRSYLRKASLPLPPASPNYERDKAIVAKLGAGASQTAVAKEYGLSRQRIQQIAKKYGARDSGTW